MTVLRAALVLALLWGLLCSVLLAAEEKERLRRLLTVVAAFAVGACGAPLLLAATTGAIVSAGMRMLGAALFLVLLVTAGGAAFTAAEPQASSGVWRGRCAVWSDFASPWLFPLLAGALSFMILAGEQFSWQVALVTVPSAIIAAYGVAGAMFYWRALSGRRLPVTRLSRLLLSAALLFCMGAASPRLDLFAPLSMKIMKFIHDFVHQFMESMLLPDHLFVTVRIWTLVGLLFTKEVGFWGGLVVWFAPVLLVSLAIVRAPLPTVAHVRQGARRRIILAAALRERRSRLLLPVLAAVVLACSVYRSLFPAVQYWNPPPITVAASDAGEIVLPLQSGEVSLHDGKIHKFSYARGRDKVRFFVLDRGDTLVVALDACAICPPDGYGQGEGTVFCYYCKTLIPLETVGRVGGCNPVPVPSVMSGDVVRISAMQLVNLWNTTVQVTTQGGGGKR